MYIYISVYLPSSIDLLVMLFWIFGFSSYRWDYIVRICTYISHGYTWISQIIRSADHSFHMDRVNMYPWRSKKFRRCLF